MHKNSQRGATITEAIIAAAILGLIAVGATKFFSMQLSSAQILEKKGAFEDAKNMIRSTLDCERTVKAFGTACKNKTYGHNVFVNLLKGDGSVLLDASVPTRLGRSWEFRAKCQDEDVTYGFKVERRYRPATMKSDDPMIKQAGTWDDAFAVPITCEKPGGGWMQSNKNCTAFCATAGLTNVASPEGSFCASGELVPVSAIDAYFAGAFNFPQGCWGGPCPYGSGMRFGQSYGNRCYGIKSDGDGQKQDHDSTDNIVACYCE